MYGCTNILYSKLHHENNLIPESTVILGRNSRTFSRYEKLGGLFLRASRPRFCLPKRPQL